MVTYIVLGIVAVAAITVAIVFCVKYSLAKAEIRRVEEASAARLSSKDDYIAGMNKVHEDALARMEEQNAAAISKLEEQNAANLKRADEQHRKDLEAMQEKFSVLANDITAKNSKDFSEQSTARIQDILKPVGEKFEEFRKRVEEADKSAGQMKASMDEKINALVGQTEKIGGEARNLTIALTNRSKVQGNFGELILKDLLLNAGLLEGEHFLCQGVITDEGGHEIKSEDGRTMIPDVLVFYPDGTTVVVDSKVSLTDYVAYCGAVTSEDQTAAVKGHIESIRKHVNELATKDYASYIPEGKRKVDYNIMFIPNDGAFLLMLDKAPKLWQEARERKVLIVSQMNLVVVLNMIQMVWKQSEREKNMDAIVSAASELMSKLESWMSVYVGIGDKIEGLSKAYDNSKKELTGSSQSVVKKIAKLERLGATRKLNSVKATSRKSGRESIIPASLTEE